ncbi:hypothetical protein N9483_06015 [Flavobacteriaceae bacterium]|nr:hypothetical protein [Flavobacteriaceae bacterium]
MSGRHQNPKVVENHSECEGEYISNYDLVFDHKDPHKNFQRAVKDMFDGYFQIQYFCGSLEQDAILD